jgi:nicotinate-nucleotide adenylyltransferase
MNRLGIFGGSFDPPHLGHLKVALQAAVELNLDRVLWIPAFHSPFKSPVETSSPQMRLEMVRLVANLDYRFIVDTRELTREGPSYTVETLEGIKNDFPEAELHLIVGEDSYRSFASWKRPDEIRNLAHLVVYRRVSSSLPPSPLVLSPGDRLLEGEPIDVTSTQIRDMLSKNNRVDHMLTLDVAAFIKANGLYLSA